MLKFKSEEDKHLFLLDINKDRNLPIEEADLKIFYGQLWKDFLWNEYG